MSSAAVEQQRDPIQQSYQQTPPASSPSAARRVRQGHDSYDLSQNTPSSSSTVKQSSMSSASIVDNMPQPPHDQYYPESSNQFNLPIRTTAQQPSSPAQSTPYDSRQSSRPQYEAAGYNSESERDRRQRTPRSSHDSPAQPSSGRSQRARQGPAQSRSQNAVGQPPIGTDLPRENSAIINHIVIDDPQTDIARERARAEEARPHIPGQEVQPVALDQTARPTPTQQRSRQEHLRNSTSHNRKEVKFGEYVLGQTLGEGEFGKVKMGWKKEGGVQVAIKLIRKESLAGNTTRLPKIHREISILKEVEHPNIVRLHEFVETERHMGIILEYASGGELFDYILNHRYLKDPAAKRLFAQLVSGVGYLHKKGIVHRDLKLENLLLDRYKNIIITDFGFANTFDPRDELGEHIEQRVGDKDFIKREGLEAIGKTGFRRGDLMLTSCGSPCYAAPELVVSDGLYTGRKVDVWSCGVILYAMLAGYLPFDDDPDNPDGDNINLLYKYIVTTPLTFPEYVTPHARDLLRRILVPDPRRRADLFEVARHSWLSEYDHLVGFIGSSTKSDMDIAKSARHQGDEPQLGRSASVREPATRSPIVAAVPKTSAGNADDTRSRTSDTKRRTVQVEYVAPSAGSARGDHSSPVVSPISPTSRTRARPEQGPIEVSPIGSGQQIPRKEVPSQAMPPPARPSRDGQPRTPQDGPSIQAGPSSRPNTRGNLPSRGNSYSQPAIATPTTENAQGRFAQPKTSPNYVMSGSLNQTPTSPTPPPDNRPMSHQAFNQFPQSTQQFPQSGGHKRSSTLGSITDRVLGRSNSRRKAQQAQQDTSTPTEKRDRRYPPVSMNNAMASMPMSPDSDAAPPRRSTDSRRSSFQFLRKNSDMPTDAQGQPKRASRRLSNLLSGNFSFGNKNNAQYDQDQSNRRASTQQRTGRPASKGLAFGRGSSRSPSQSTMNSGMPQNQYNDDRNTKRRSTLEKPLPQGMQRKQFRDDGYGGNLLDQQDSQPDRSQPNDRYYSSTQDINNQNQHAGARAGDQEVYSASQPQLQQYRGADDGYGSNQLEQTMSNAQSIRPQQRRFGDAYERGHDGSSSGARRVMDFFRRRGKERSSKE